LAPLDRAHRDLYFDIKCEGKEVHFLHEQVQSSVYKFLNELVQFIVHSSKKLTSSLFFSLYGAASCFSLFIYLYVLFPQPIYNHRRQLFYRQAKFAQKC